MTRRRRLDPVSLEILWGRLVSMVDEAAATFVRTSFSMLVREANDYAIVLTDTEGRSLAQSSLSIPSFIGTLPATVKHFLRLFPLKTLKPGDVLATNDPWIGTGHVHDVNIAMPVFHKGRPVAIVAITSHMPDIGGRLRSGGIREIFEEGLQLPPLKLMSRGKPDESVLEVIRRNVRVPEQTVGDIYGQVAAARMLEERLIRLLHETGIDLATLGREVRGRSETAMREAIRALPDGRYRRVVAYDGFETPTTVDCKINVRGSRLSIDYSGSSPQLPKSVNVVPNYTFAFSAFALKAILSPDIPNNEGSFAPISTWAPEGSIFNPRYPAASGARGMVGHMMVPAIMGALSEIVPDRVVADGGGSCSFAMGGEHRGRRFGLVAFMGSGHGASAKGDGMTVKSFPSNLANLPMEMMEAEAPILMTRRAVRRGSGGRGRNRGGDGQAQEFLYRGDSAAQIAFVMTRLSIPPAGFAGGDDGQTGRLRINGRAIDHTQQWVLNPGDRLLCETAGGGGFGRPGV